MRPATLTHFSLSDRSFDSIEESCRAADLDWALVVGHLLVGLPLDFFDAGGTANASHGTHGAEHHQVVRLDPRQ